MKVHHDLDDLERDILRVSSRAPRDLARVVSKNAKEGNALAKAFASEQHTMFGDEDILYPPSFTAEMRLPLMWEYGPDMSIGDGSQAAGYEHGSRNSPPHHDLLRSGDIIGAKFARDVHEAPDRWFW